VSEPDRPAWGQLRTIVSADPVRATKLLAVRDRSAFCSAVAEIAREDGLDLTAADIGSELDAARRRWLERWI
jgi:hypothetical protein